MSGWVRLDRDWRENPMFRGEYSRGEAWLWLVTSAAWKPSRTRIKGETVELARGELSFAQRFLADKWGWSKSRVDRFIAELRAENMIETRSKIGATAGHAAGQGQCIITICNYSKYQDVCEVQRGNGVAVIGATAGQQRGKEEQGNKLTIELEPYGSCPSGDEPEPEIDDQFQLVPDNDTGPILKPEHFVEAWNEIANRLGKPRVRSLTPERRQRVRARIAGYSLDEFREVLGNIEASAFLRGDRGWQGCTFDWVTKKVNFQKVLEGNYHA